MSNLHTYLGWKLGTLLRHGKRVEPERPEGAHLPVRPLKPDAPELQLRVFGDCLMHGMLVQSVSANYWKSAAERTSVSPRRYRATMDEE